MEREALFTRSMIGFIVVALLVYALIIAGLYYFTYLPKQAELAAATQEVAAAQNDARAARQ